MKYIVVYFGDCDYGCPLEDACEQFVKVKKNGILDLTYITETIEALFRAYSVIRDDDKYSNIGDPKRSNMFTNDYLSLMGKVYYAEDITDVYNESDEGEVVFIDANSFKVYTPATTNFNPNIHECND